MFPRTLTGRIISHKKYSLSRLIFLLYNNNNNNNKIIIVIIIIIIKILIITTQHKSRTTCLIFEYVFRFYIYYTELSHIANGDLLDLYFITQQQGIRTHNHDNFSSGLHVCTCSLTW